MIMQHASPEVFNRFREVAGQFRAVVDAARSVERDDLVLKIYRLLPLLIGEAIGLAVVEPSEYGNQKERRNARMSEQQWGELYSLLQEKLGDWNLYSQVFDPTKDREAIDRSLADDSADIYRDLKEGLVLHHSDLAPLTTNFGSGGLISILIGAGMQWMPDAQSTLCWSPL